jgi:hypothetical protein
MSQFRLVALLLVSAAGCYKEAPESTLPEPSYFAGPPGGVIDPDSSYQPGSSYQNPGEPAYETDMRGDEAVPPSAPDVDADDDADDLAVAPGADDANDPYDTGDSGDAEDLSQPPAAPAPGDPTAGVTDAEIETTLEGYGQWVETPDYGPVWRPDATVVGVDFTPYETAGSWAYTDAGWAFTSDYNWGWLPFHYGRWGWFHDYWAWVPGYNWGPAWVEWRHGSGVVGWRPLRPRIRDHRHSAAPTFSLRAQVRDHRRPRQHVAHWRFATESDFGRPRIRSHLYGNLAEGLRVTSTVNAPPLRARATIRSRDLMRNRFATQSGRQGGPHVRDHRSPARVHAPGEAIRPRQPYGAPARAYQPREVYRPPIRTQPYGAPTTRSYDPSRAHQPPVRNAPPVRMYQPPARTYQPPGRTYQPPPASGPRSAPPVRMYQPPARTYQPPSRSYQPPPRSYQPPSRSYQPPPRSAPAQTYTPPARTYAPPAASPSRSSSPPARSTSSTPHRASPAPRSSHGRHR